MQLADFGGILKAYGFGGERRMKIYGKKILYFDSVTSTFDKLAELAPEDGLAVAAKAQTAGIGRNGRHWASDEGGVYFSFYIIPKERSEELPFLAIVCALAAQRTLKKYVDCKIKWPNDIVYDGKKICGILTRASFINSSVHIAAGIGINANNTDFGELSFRAQSLKSILNRELDGKELINEFFRNFEDVYLNTEKKKIISEYAASCITVGSEVALHFNSDDEPKRGKCVGVNADGSLAVETDDGVLNVNYGEVSVRGIYGYC